MDIIVYIISLVVLLFLLYFCHRTIVKYFSLLSSLLFGKSEPAVYFYFLLFLPGIVLHELSHLFTASVLGVPTGRITIFPQKSEGSLPAGRQGWTLGQVDSAKTDLFRSSLIGLAPMVIGSITLIFIFNLGLGIKTAEDFTRLTFNWQTLIYLYLALAFANTMFLSDEDRTSIWAFPGLLIFLFVLLKLLGLVIVLNYLENLFRQIIFPPVLSFSLTVGLDFFLIILLALTTTVLAKFRG